MKKDKTIYELSVDDIQEVALDVLERKLTAKEVELVSDKVGDYIPWFDAIENAIYHVKIPIASKQKKQRRTIKGH
jgi:hypothetical protein